MTRHPGQAVAVAEVRRRIAIGVKAARVSRGLTQEAVAHRAGLATRHLQKVEAADVNLTIDSLARIANALGVDIDALVGDGDRKP